MSPSTVKEDHAKTDVFTATGLTVTDQVIFWYILQLTLKYSKETQNKDQLYDSVGKAAKRNLSRNLRKPVMMNRMSATVQKRQAIQCLFIQQYRGMLVLYGEQCQFIEQQSIMTVLASEQCHFIQQHCNMLVNTEDAAPSHPIWWLTAAVSKMFLSVQNRSTVIINLTLSVIQFYLQCDIIWGQYQWSYNVHSVFVVICKAAFFLETSRDSSRGQWVIRLQSSGV